MGSQLFLLSLADIFSVYPQIFNEILRAEEEKREQEGGRLTKDFLYLPSDAAWREKVYYRLLDIQKQINVAIETGIAPEEIGKKKDKPVWDPVEVQLLQSTRSTPTERVSVGTKCVKELPIDYIDINFLGNWSLENIAKAAKLLRKPPIPVVFCDEHEMRKVYSLIYDVFRYKHVLIQALDDVRFYSYFPALKAEENRVWLMLFELHTRHFLRRPAEEAIQEQLLYRDADVSYISKCLWDHRVRLAAAISRLRIKKGALALAQLLPVHLRDEKVSIAAANPIISGWINSFRVKDKESAQKILKDMGLIEVKDEYVKDGDRSLEPNQYKWDTVCPLFLTCLPKDRAEFAQSELVKNNLLVLQDRTFSLAPAILSKLLDYFNLEGDVVQTHVSSPKSTAYLAALFRSVNKLNDFLAFGVENNMAEYKGYFDELGVDNVRLFSQNFCSVALEARLLETVVGIYATPPNSFSGVADPIDLICSRGGDLSMLEVLTESEISKDGKIRVTQVLSEQRDTLRLSMSRPQVQFVLYETHSIVGSENQDMVKRCIHDINHSAYLKHVQAYREIRNQVEEGANGPFEEEPILVTSVPETDEFELASIPDICANQDNCLDFSSLGCYIAVLKRKQITKLDAKYLIKMAEARGLFGNADRKKSAKPKSQKRTEKKSDKTKEQDSNMRKSKLKQNDISSVIERLTTPTHSSAVRSNSKTISSVSNKALTFDSKSKECPRHYRYHAGCDDIPVTEFKIPTPPPEKRAKLWWRQASRYVNNLQRATVNGNENLLPPLELLRSQSDDYKVARLQRLDKRMQSALYNRVPYPVAVNQLQFQGFQNLNNDEIPRLHRICEYLNFLQKRKTQNTKKGDQNYFCICGCCCKHLN